MVSIDKKITYTESSEIGFSKEQFNASENLPFLENSVNKIFYYVPQCHLL